MSPPSLGSEMPSGMSSTMRASPRSGSNHNRERFSSSPSMGRSDVK
ncbi:hypothetical protein [Kocuria varians]|nr:hypothetical protein [Kocuria varians]